MRIGPGRVLAAAMLVAGVFAPPAAEAAGDQLTIGLAQFPAGMNPVLAGQDVLTYAAGFGLHPITTFGHDGRVICLLCTDVPDLENGLVRREGNGLAVTIKLKPDLAWGDGTKVTAADIAFTWKLQHDPKGGFVATHPWTRATSVDVVDEHTAVLHLDRTYTSYQLWDMVLPEHVEGPVVAQASKPADYIDNTRYNREPTDPGLVGRAVHARRVSREPEHRLRAEPALAGAEAGLPAYRAAPRREHRGAAGEPAIGRRGHDAIRHRALHRPGGGARARAWRPLPLHLQAAARVRASRAAA